MRMKNKLLKSTMVLSASMVVAKFLGALYRIPLSNVLGTQGIGIYQMVFPLYSLCLVFCTGGVSTYLSQKISKFRAKGDFEQINKMLKTTKNLCVVYGLFVSVMLFVFCGFIAKIQGNTLATLGYVAISVGFVFSCLLGVYRGYFQGFENMLPTAISQILEQTIKLAFGLVFAKLLLGYGVEWGVFGALFGISISEIISYFFMIFYAKKYKAKKTFAVVCFCDYKQTIKSFLSLSLTAIMLPIISAIDSLFAIKFMTISGLDLQTATSLFGIYSGMITPVLNFPILFISTICVALLPNLSYIIQKNQNANTVINNAVFFVYFFALPCTGGLVSVSVYVLKILFPVISGQFFPVANIALKISCFNILSLSLISLGGTILQAYGKYKLPCISLSIGVILKLFLIIIIALKPQINIIGLAITNTTTYFTSAIINIIFLKKYTPLNLSKKQIIIPAIISLFMASSIIVLEKFIKFNNYINLSLLVGFGVIVYIFLIFALKIINFSQIKQMIKKHKKS